MPLSVPVYVPASSHPDVAKVAFTGSVETGRRVNLAAAANLRPTTMELGGKSALIVFDDVDIEKSVEWALVSASDVCESESRCRGREVGIRLTVTGREGFKSGPLWYTRLHLSTGHWHAVGHVHSQFRPFLTDLHTVPWDPYCNNTRTPTHTGPGPNVAPTALR